MRLPAAMIAATAGGAPSGALAWPSGPTSAVSPGSGSGSAAGGARAAAGRDRRRRGRAAEPSSPSRTEARPSKPRSRRRAPPARRRAPPLRRGGRRSTGGGACDSRRRRGPFSRKRRARGRSGAASGEPRPMRLSQLRSALTTSPRRPPGSSRRRRRRPRGPVRARRGRGRRLDTPLYCYRPLTGVHPRALGAVGRLPSLPPRGPRAESAGRVDGYLERRACRGRRRAREPPTPRCTLPRRVFEESTDFVFHARALRPRVPRARGASSRRADRERLRDRAARHALHSDELRSATACRWPAATPSPTRPTRSAGTPSTAAPTCSSCCAGSRSPVTPRRSVRCARAWPAC